MKEQEFDSIKALCPSNVNMDHCSANDSGRCKYSTCPFIFWGNKVKNDKCPECGKMLKDAIKKLTIQENFMANKNFPDCQLDDNDPLN